MKIDWFTVVAQVINFLILAWLLKRFLYKPVLNAIDEREKKITAQLNEAASKKEEAQKEREEFKQKNKAFDQQREQQLNKVTEEANAERQKLFEEVRNDTNALRAKMETSLQEEQQNRSNEIKQRIQSEVFSLSSKALSELASVDVEAEMINAFTSKLKAMSEDEKIEFKKAVDVPGKTVTIQTAFPLNDTKQAGIAKVINEIIGKEILIQYQVEPALISGIEISSQQYKLSWTMEDYLSSIKDRIAEQQKEKNGGI